MLKCRMNPKPRWCSNQCLEENKNDPQQTKLYCFEDFLCLSNKYRKLKSLTLDECRSIVEVVCSEYKIQVPEIKDGRGMKVARGGFSEDGKLQIKLPKAFRYKLAVLHEVTHCIIQNGSINVKHKPQDHGCLFVSCLLNIYSKHLGIPITVLKKNARYFGLSYDHFSKNPHTKA